MNHNLILIFNLSALLFVFFAFAAYAGDVSIETGNILTEKDNELFLSLKNTEAEGHEYRLVSGGYLGNIGVGNFAVYDATAESARLTIDTNGKVIIGTRDTPGSLDLWGGQIVTSGLSLIKYVNRIPVSFSRIIQVGSDSSNAEMRIIQSNRITMTLKSDGNVGIGTTRPTSKLSITGATTGGLTLLDLNSTDDTDSAISFKTEDYKWNIGRTDGGNFFFWDGSGTAGTRMVIQNGTGRVGIGTTLPAGKLDVYSGALFISGARTYTPLNVPSIHTDSTDTALFVPTSTGGNLDLRLYIDDDASDMFSIWGNSCRTGGTGGGCQNLAKSLEIARFVGGGTVALGLNGNVGIGNTEPKAKLDVAGEVKFGSTGLTCNSNAAGAIKYNSGMRVMEFCDGTSWKAIGQSGGGETAGGETAKAVQCSVHGSATDSSTTACSKPTCEEISRNTYDDCSNDAGCDDDHYRYVNDVKLEGTIEIGGSVTPSVEVRCDLYTKWAIYFYDGTSWIKKCAGACTAYGLEWESCSAFNLPSASGTYYLRGIENYRFEVKSACVDKAIPGDYAITNDYADHDDIKIEIK